MLRPKTSYAVFSSNFASCERAFDFCVRGREFVLDRLRCQAMYVDPWSRLVVAACDGYARCSATVQGACE